MPLGKVEERLRMLTAKETLSPEEEREHNLLCEYIEEYERDWEALGAEGREALMLWRLLDGQRVLYSTMAGVVPGDISFSAIGFLFDMYGIEESRRQEVFERIMAVEEVAKEVRERWS
ncbi:MAG: hypothetical protein QXI19_06735 [Candidatus Caldarchaeum sp.]